MWDNAQTVLAGVWLTLGITLASFTTGALLALPLTAGAQSRRALVRHLTRFVIDTFRGVPPIVLLFLLYFGLAQQGLTLTALFSAVAGLGLISAAYLSEVYRSGLLAIASAQRDASSALGLSRMDAMRYVIGPLAIRVVIPGAATWGIGLLKESAAVSILGLQDITFRAYTASQNAQGYESLAVFFIAGLVYVVLSVPIALLARWSGNRLHGKLAL